MTDHDGPAGEDGGPYGVDPGIIFASIREYSLRPKRKRRALACLYFLSGALILFGGSLSNLANDPTIDQARTGYIVTLIGSTIGCLSCLAAISYFRMLTERLSPAGLVNRA